MSPHKTYREELKVFVASPGDVPQEREKIREIILALNSHPRYRQYFVIQPLIWDDPLAPVPLSHKIDPESSLMEYGERPDQCQLVIGILKHRLGSPLSSEQYGKNVYGEPYTGTEWEINNALSDGQNSHNEEVFVFVSRETFTLPKGTDNVEFQRRHIQYKKVERFIEDLRDKTGVYRRGVIGYRDISEFEKKARTAIEHWLEKRLKAEQEQVSIVPAYLQDLAQILEIPTKGGRFTSKPQFFRKSGGPIAVDFEADPARVYRRPLVDDIKEQLRNKQGAPGVLLTGLAASGKSVVGRQVGYELTKEGWQVYLYQVSLGEPLPVEMLRNDLGALNCNECAVVIEDIHLKPTETNSLLRLRQPSWPPLLLTSRPIDFARVFYKQENYLDRLIKMPLESLDVTEQIIRLFFRNLGIKQHEAWMEDLKEASRESLWLLAYALESLDIDGMRAGRWKGVDSKSIQAQVRKDLDNLQFRHDENPLYPQMLIALSVLYRYEIPTAQGFLNEALPGAGQVIAHLANLGEVVRKGKGLFGLPHSALAELYFEFASDPVWEDPLYSNEATFVQHYLTSKKALNAFDLFEGVWSF